MLCMVWCLERSDSVRFQDALGEIPEILPSYLLHRTHHAIPDFMAQRIEVLVQVVLVPYGCAFYEFTVQYSTGTVLVRYEQGSTQVYEYGTSVRYLGVSHPAISQARHAGSTVPCRLAWYSYCTSTSAVLTYCTVGLPFAEKRASARPRDPPWLW